MAKYIITIVLASLYNFGKSQSRAEFNYRDATFTVGQVKIVKDFVWGCSYPITGLFRLDLDSLTTFLKTQEKIKIKISVHSDLCGSKEYNQKLTERRAETIVDYLVSSGISKRTG